MIDQSLVVVYWDTSAILSALLQDSHSDEARKWIEKSGLHLMSTLSFAETHAVLARIRREKLLADVLVNAARESLKLGPWNRLNISPQWSDIEDLAFEWNLRGADLWHLATARTVQREIPELLLLTFDDRLRFVASGVGLVG